MSVVAERIAAGVEAGAGAASRARAGDIAEIEGLRGVAMIWVVIFHYVVVRDRAFADPWIEAISSIAPLNILARNGYLGVDLFFLISGFLLTLPWFLRAAGGGPAPSIAPYYARRFWRIAPAYYVQLVVLFALVLPLLKGITYWRSDLYVLAANGLAHGLFVHNTTPLTSGSLGINGALWTLAVEAQYYLLVPFLAPLFQRAPLASLAGAFAVAIAWQYGARHGLDAIVALQVALGTPWGWSEAVVRQLLLTQLPSYAAHFALGILAGRAWVAWRLQPPGPRVRRTIRGAAVAALLALYVVYGHLGPVLGDASWIVSPLAFGAAFFALAARPRNSGSIVGSAPLRFLGRISYSAYLYHLLLLALWNAFAPRTLGWASFPLFLAAVLSLAWISWRYIEERFRVR
jgi:peptidoglycan/LPS O-acetylase OafA/YrhL